MMRKGSLVWIATIAIALTMILSALPAVPGNAQGEEINPEETLYIAFQSDIMNLNELEPVGNSVWRADSIGWVYDALTGLTPEYTTIPLLATDYTMDTDDALNWTFNIRQGVLFHDGVLMNANDVMFSYQYLFTADLYVVSAYCLVWPSQAAWETYAEDYGWGPGYAEEQPWFENVVNWFDDMIVAGNLTTDTAIVYHENYAEHSGDVIWNFPFIAGVEVTGLYQIKFHLREPYFAFLKYTTSYPVIPLHIWKDHIIPGGNPGNPGSYTYKGVKFPSDEFNQYKLTIDYTFGSPEETIVTADNPQAKATIGTGPFMFYQWAKGVNIIMKRFDDYWGKDYVVSAPGSKVDGFHIYPANVKWIYVKLYSSTEAALIALKKGEVDYIDWPIPPGYYDTIRTDPNIQIFQTVDSGYFYLAFNMREKPMSDIHFRRAVSMCIDKDYIVDRLLLGFGMKGTVPVTMAAPWYVNESATPPPFDLAGAQNELDSAGYLDVNGDGWREMPDGKPIKLVIITPPKDYDPVRADTGIMISKNLKTVGLNIDSSPTDFNTIVTLVFVNVNFDMYILGWRLGLEPTYLYDFFHSSQAAPDGYNTPGYSNPEVDRLLEEMMTTTDFNKLVKIVKDIQGILVRDLPYNVLYYRTNIEAVRKDRWQGWMIGVSSVYNTWSLSRLHRGAAPPAPKAEVAVMAPDVITTGQPFKVAAYLYDLPNGTFKQSDKITIQIPELNYTKTFTNVQVAEDEITLTMPYSKLTLKVTATVGGTTKETVKYINVVPRKVAPYVQISMDANVLAPGETAHITVKVTDEMGNPLQGVTVNLDKELLMGSATPDSGVTDSNGEVTFMYTAPEASKLINTNLYDVFRVDIDAPSILTSQKIADYKIPIETTGSEWYAIDLAEGMEPMNGIDMVIQKDEVVPVTVKLVDINGNPVAGKTLTVEISDPDKLTAEETEVTTGSDGTATFNLKGLYDGDLTSVVVKFTSYFSAYVLPFSMEFIVGNNYVEGVYASYITAPTRFLTTDEITIEYHLFTADEDLNTIPAASEVGEVDLPFGSFGMPAWIDEPAHTEDNPLGTYGYWWYGMFYLGVTDENGTMPVKILPLQDIMDQKVPLQGWDPNGVYYETPLVTLRAKPFGVRYYDVEYSNPFAGGVTSKAIFVPQSMVKYGIDAYVPFEVKDLLIVTSEGPLAGASLMVTDMRNTVTYGTATTEEDGTASVPSTVNVKDMGTLDSTMEIYVRVDAPGLAKKHSIDSAGDSFWMIETPYFVTTKVPYFVIPDDYFELAFPSDVSVDKYLAESDESVTITFKLKNVMNETITGDELEALVGEIETYSDMLPPGEVEITGEDTVEITLDLSNVKWSANELVNVEVKIGSVSFSLPILEKYVPPTGPQVPTVTWQFANNTTHVVINIYQDSTQVGTISIPKPQPVTEVPTTYKVVLPIVMLIIGIAIGLPVGMAAKKK